jgi:hypothetical protein
MLGNTLSMVVDMIACQVLPCIRSVYCVIARRKSIWLSS